MSGWDSEYDIESLTHDITPKLSTGQDSTLGNWRDLVVAVFGEGPSSHYLDSKIADQGRDEVVIADERQLLAALWQMQHP